MAALYNEASASKGRTAGRAERGITMVEPATTTPATSTPPAAGGPEPDVLLATKLHVPRPRPGLVPRPRLAERLTEGLGGGLVLVCTPAGFGKTTLLADWAATTSWPVAWLSLDEGDNDPARLAAGQTNRGIAQELVVTLDTVKRHVSHLFVKLQVTNRTQAVARARQLGLLP
jgi:ATP/maltotriose-dependent transcriptional regulator MalT